MAQDITWLGVSYPDIPAIRLPKTGGGFARFDDVSGVTAGAGDVVSGKSIVDATGETVPGTLIIQTIYSGSSAPSSSTGINGDVYIQTS